MRLFLVKGGGARAPVPHSWSCHCYRTSVTQHSTLTISPVSP